MTISKLAVGVAIAVAVFSLLDGSAAPLARADGPAPDDPLPAGVIARAGTTRFRHGREIGAAALSANGAVLATLDVNGFVRRFEASSGRALLGLGGGARAAHAVALSPDGEAVAVSQSRSIVVYGPAPGAAPRLLTDAGGMDWLAVAFAPDGKTIAAAGADASVSIWETATGKRMRRMAAPPGSGSEHSRGQVAFSPDGKIVAAAFQDLPIRLLDAASGAVLGTIDFAAGDASVWTTALAFSRDGRSLAVALVNGVARVYEVEACTERCRLDAESADALAFSGDGKLLAVASSGQVRLFDPARGAALRSVGATEADPTVLVGFSADGRALLDASMTGIVRRRDVETGKQPAELEGFPAPGCGALVWVDARTVAGIAGGCLRLLDGATGADTGRVDGAGPPTRGAVAVSTDGKLVAFAANEAIALADLATRKEVRRLKLPGLDDGASIVAFSPDGGTVAAAGHLAGIRLFRTATGELGPLVGAAEGDDWSYGYASSFAFAPDGKTLAASQDTEVRLYDVATRKERRRFDVGAPAELAFSPDGGVLAVVTDGKARLFDPANGSELRTFDGLCGQAFAFSPDGRIVAVGGDAHSVRLCDTGSGKELRRLAGHEGEITSLAFSPDGKRLASASSDGTVLFWDLAAAGSPPAGPGEK